MDKSVVMKKGLRIKLPSVGEKNTIYFAEDTAELFKPKEDGGRLLPYSGIVGLYDTLEDMEISLKLEGKFYILKDEDKYSIYMYDKSKGFFPITAKADGGDMGLSQKTKLNVVGTKEEPYVLNIPINFTSEFLKPPIEVLRMEGEGEENVVELLADFDNADKDDFEPNPFVVMDGTMRLRTLWEEECETIDEENKIYSYDLSNLDKIKEIKAFDII